MCPPHLQTLDALPWEAQTVIFQLHLTMILIKQLMFQSLPKYSPF